MDLEELDKLVEQLASKDWRVQRIASEALVAAGDTGLEAVLGRLSDARPPVRRACLDWLDHYAGSQCFEAVRTLALTDPVPDVRRAAVHALGCVRCKPEPLDPSVIDFLTTVALQDTSRKLRMQAIWLLNAQEPDERAAVALEAVLGTETAHDIVSSAHRALRHHSPEYRRLTDQRARELSTATRQQRM